MTDLHHSPLQSGLLAAVSRSFYLSLRVLPGPVRAPLSLGYLLARATDTIADVPARPAEERQRLLADFAQAVESGDDGDVAAAALPFAADVSHTGERILLERLPECLAALRHCHPEERKLIRQVLQRIIRGQTLDLERFPDAAPRQLRTAAELDEYTWLVAGCVGEFWTQICLLHMPECTDLPPDEWIAHGVSFGKGLQLVNILRDLPKDMSLGRCYLPQEELRAAGLADFAWPAPDWKPWHSVRRHWLEQARRQLDCGREYVRALRGARLRLAVLLPLYIGEATLDLLAAQPESQPPAAAKITRSSVKRLFLKAAWHSAGGI